MSNLIWIHTRRYSTLIKRIFEEYHENVEIYIEGYRYTDNDVPKLLKDWCTNRIIKRTLDFSLKRNHVELFGFHDTPDEFWAASSERPFVERLANEKIVRFRVYPHAQEVFSGNKSKSSLVKSLYKFLKSLFSPEAKA